jgi:hypothetical protein
VWREAPVIPTSAAERAALETLTVEPAAIEPSPSAVVTVSLPEGSLAPGETTDVWWMPTQTVLATLTAGADGALPPTEITLPGPLGPGTYDIVVRGDTSAPSMALAAIEVAAASPSPAAAPDDDAGGWPWWVIVILLVLAAAATAVVVARRRVVLARRRRRAEG